MKKIILASLVVAMASTSTLATAKFSFSNVNKHLNTQNLYVEGDVGYAKLEGKENSVKIKDDNTSFTIALGKDLGVWRYQADYTNFGKVELKDIENEKLKAQSIGLSTIYDFASIKGFTPYVGGRLGINKLEYDRKSIASNFSADKTTVGIGVLAGTQYNFNPKVALNVGAEYNYLGKVDTAINDEAKASEYGVKVGLRYNF